MQQKQLHPDAADISAAAVEKKSTNKTRYTPKKDADFLTVSKAVSASWLANPGITLLWKTQAQFDVMVTAYETAFGGRLSEGGNRPSVTQTLKNLDKQMDDAVSDVKIYIQRKFKKDNAFAEYARYGIVQAGGNYRLPRDRDQRKSSLPLMIAAIAADAFGAEEYGTAFWTGIQTDYLAALSSAEFTDGSVSINVAAKNEQKKAITKVMDALRFVLRGNYPDTYAAEYRDWGWQKEDY